MRAISNSASLFPLSGIFVWGALAVLLVAGLLAGIFVRSDVGDAAPIVKVGVIAPFEGIGRPLGYALLPEVQTAVAQANAAGKLGRYRVAVVAFNDDLYGATAEAQAKALALDPDVMAVIGPWTHATAEAAIPILASAGLPTLSGASLDQPEIQLAHTPCPSSQAIAEKLLDRVDALGRPVAVAGPDNDLQAALLAVRPGLAVIPVGAMSNPPSPSVAVIHTGEAAEVAADVRRWRENGWEGDLLGGSDLAQPWFAAHAGIAATGARALACGPATPKTVSGDAATAAAMQAARTAAGAVLGALADDIASEAAPTRAGVARALAAQSWPSETHWLEVDGGAQWSEPTSAAD